MDTNWINNRKDIIKSKSQSWVGWKDYSFNISNPDYDYFSYVSLHVPIMGQLYRMYVHKYDPAHQSTEDIEDKEKVYEGKIDNEERFEMLLELLDLKQK